MKNAKPKLTILQKILVAAGIAGGLYCLYCVIMFFVIFSSAPGEDPVEFYRRNDALLNTFVKTVELGNPSDFANELGELMTPPELGEKLDRRGYLFQDEGGFRLEFYTGGWAGGNHRTLIYKSDGTDLTQEEMRYERATFKRINEHWFAVSWND